jgi:phosphate transport system protein
MRVRFDEQLETLNVELIKMGALCEDAISAAAKALIDGDGSLVRNVLAADSEIDRKERDIESMCLRLLLQQQPVARDLRLISSALKMISDMERIGDQASDIAEITRYIADNDAKSKIHIADMARATIKMVTDSVESFVKKDILLARAVMDYDDVVDRLFEEVRQELIGLIGDDAKNGGFCIDLLMIAKYFERIGDHATNIAEWVEFSITGVHPKA